MDGSKRDTEHIPTEDILARAARELSDISERLLDLETVVLELLGGDKHHALQDFDVTHQSLVQLVLVLRSAAHSVEGAERGVPRALLEQLTLKGLASRLADTHHHLPRAAGMEVDLF